MPRVDPPFPEPFPKSPNCMVWETHPHHQSQAPARLTHSSLPLPLLPLQVYTLFMCRLLLLASCMRLCALSLEPTPLSSAVAHDCLWLAFTVATLQDLFSAVVRLFLLLMCHCLVWVKLPLLVVVIILLATILFYSFFFFCLLSFSGLSRWHQTRKEISIYTTVQMFEVGSLFFF